MYVVLAMPLQVFAEIAMAVVIANLKFSLVAKRNVMKKSENKYRNEMITKKMISL